MISVYYSIILLFLSGLAAHDIKTRHVPDIALVIFLLFALPSPAITSVFSTTGASSLLLPTLRAVSGALLGFVPLLAAAMLSKEGAGIGGGDIKLAAILGYIFGPAEIILIIIIATLTAIAYSLVTRLIRKRRILSIPFVPFMLLGCLTIIVFYISSDLL